MFSGYFLLALNLLEKCLAKIGSGGEMARA